MTHPAVHKISMEEIRTILAVCQKLVAPTNPSAAVMIKYAASDLGREDVSEVGDNVNQEEADPRQDAGDETRTNNK